MENQPTQPPENPPPVEGGGNVVSLEQETLRIAAEHQQPDRRGPGRPRKNAGPPVATVESTPQAGPGVPDTAGPSPADIEIIRDSLETLVKAGDEMLGAHIGRMAARVVPDKAEVARLVESRSLGDPQAKLLASQGAILAARWGLNSENIPGIICAAVLAVYGAANLKIIAELKTMTEHRHAPARPPADKDSGNRV